MNKTRRGSVRPGQSYRDPVYDGIETRLEQKHKLPTGIMRSIRTRGERSNADQVSSAGARSVYQIIPSTRDAFKKKYGVDAYASPEAAAEVAALHLRESFARGGDWNRAVAEYHGGTDKRNWGDKTAAYVARAGDGSQLTVPAGENGAVMLPEGIDLQSIPMDDLLNMSPEQLGNTRRPVGPQRPDPSKRPSEKRDRHIASLTGGKGVTMGAPSDSTPVLDSERGLETQAVEDQDWANSATFLDRAYHAMEDGWLGTKIMEALSEEHHEADPGFHDFYMKNWQSIEDYAHSDDEVYELRDATSVEDLAAIQTRIAARRFHNEVIDSSGNGLGFRLMAGLTDPVGFMAGAGAGKVLDLAGLGSRALLASGSTGKAAVSLMSESAGVNLGFTAALDAAGERQDSSDYLWSGVSGLAIGAALSPFVLRGGAHDNSVSEMVSRERVIAAEAAAKRETDARIELGADATPEQIRLHVDGAEARERREWLTTSLADVPDDLRLLSNDPDRLLTADPEVKARVTAQGNLDAIADEAERSMVAEHLARANAILDANPIDKDALKTSLKLVGFESTGIRLLSSESPVARAVGAVLLEGTTGAAGRRRTAAMSQAVRERLYGRYLLGYDSLYHQYRKAQGRNLVMEAWDGRVRREFNQRVFTEIEARGDTTPGTTFDANPAVIKAADLWERGMNAMRAEQQHVDTVGAARLGDTSRGYVTHRIEPSKVLRLTPAQQIKVREALAGQFIDPKNGFDADFSKKLATKYLERAMDRAKGGYDVPVNLHSPEAADIVRDSLEAMNLGADEVEKLMGKFSRGGAGHTKRRLRISMSADIGDGMTMADLFNTDIPNLYRSYARRVSGEVALAQYGIMGKKGLNVLRKAIASTGGTAEDMHAFDQIAAEFMNTPYGVANHNYMDNVRIATSLSRLGGMGFTQLAEYGNGITAVGVQRVFSSIKAMPRLAKEVTHFSQGGVPSNPILASLDTLGGPIGLDDYTLTRLFDVKDNDIQLYSSERVGVATRALRAAGNLQASMSGHRMITAVQTRGMAEQIVHKAMAFIRSGAEDAALDDMGIGPELRAAIRKDLPNIAEFDGNRLTKLDLSKSKLSGDQLMSLRDAIERGSSQIIQRTYKGETGKWAHSGFLKLLFQFRTFSLISVEKQWGRNRANYGAIKSSLYLMGAMSFALPIYMARMQVRMIGMSRKEREKFADTNLTPQAMARATLNYASSAGLLGDILDIGGGFASDYGLIDPDTIPTMGARGQGKGQLIGGVVAPGVGLVEDIWDGSHGNGKKLAKALPGANLPFVQPVITGLTN